NCPSGSKSYPQILVRRHSSKPRFQSEEIAIRYHAPASISIGVDVPIVPILPIMRVERTTRAPPTSPCRE
ncbi:MAG: hypothetical protein WD069_21845, partial [Planctomycetales bacterium]